MKKVILICSTFCSEKKGGVSSFVENRAHFLSKKTNVIVCGLGKSYIDEAVEFVSFGNASSFKYYFIFSWFKLFFICLKNRDAIIEIHNIPVSIPVFLFFKCRYVFHGPSRLEAKAEGKSVLKQKIAYFIEKTCLKFSSKVYVVSNFNRDLLKSEHQLKQKHTGLILPKFRYKSDYSNQIESQNDALTFVLIRRLVKRTGVVPFVKLFEKMLASSAIPNDSKLIIAGIGSEKEALIKTIEKCNFKQNISYLGLISEEEKNHLYQTADYNVVPTLELEGFGLVIIEAGICGCKSIVSNVDAMPEVIGYLNNQGIIYNNKEELFSVFKNLSKNNYNRNELAQITKNKFFFD